jgi:uncharacterized membrane protein
MILLRFTHVFFGALWVGMMAFQTFFLMPALGEAGPDSGKIMASLARRRIPTVMLLIALLTLGSGVWLLMRFVGGDAAIAMRTPMGRALGWGGVAAIVAFIIGMSIVRPAMMKAMSLSQSGGSPEEIGRLRARAGKGSRFVSALLLIALALMAVARYL